MPADPPHRLGGFLPPAKIPKISILNDLQAHEAASSQVSGSHLAAPGLRFSRCGVFEHQAGNHHVFSITYDGGGNFKATQCATCNEVTLLSSAVSDSCKHA